MKKFDMQRYWLLYLLTFLSIPCWIGVAGVMFVWYDPFAFYMDVGRVSDYFRLLGYVAMMSVPYVVTALFVRRAYDIIRGKGTKVVFVKSWRSVIWSVLGMFFWGFWMTGALWESRFVYASCKQFLRDAVAMDDVCWFELWIVLTYFLPFVSMLYCTVLSYLRSDYLVSRAEVKSQT